MVVVLHLLLASGVASAETPTDALSEIAKAKEDYDLVVFYARSRSFLERFPEHRAAEKVRYEFALQLIAENLMTPQSPAAQEARALLKVQEAQARSADARFDAALLRLKFIPNSESPVGPAQEALRRHAKHPERGRIYVWLIAVLEQRRELQQAAKFAKRYLEEFKPEERGDYDGLMKRAQLLGRRAPFDKSEWARIGPLGRRLTLVDFWATWCAPCIAAQPKLAALLEREKKNGFKIIAVNVDDDKDAMTKHVRRAPLPYRNLHSPFSGSIDERFGITTLPAYLLLDPSGHILASDIAESQLDARITEALRPSSEESK